MTNFREILRLNSLGLSNADVAEAASCSRNTVSKVLKACSEKGIMWPLPNEINDSDLQALLFSAELLQPKRKMPDLGYIHKELQRMGVTRKLLFNAPTVLGVEIFQIRATLNLKHDSFFQISRHSFFQTGDYIIYPNV